MKRSINTIKPTYLNLHIKPLNISYKEMQNIIEAEEREREEEAEMAEQMQREADEADREDEIQREDEEERETKDESDSQEIKKRKRERYTMCCQDINITTCHYCKQSCVNDQYLKKRGKKEICWKCLPSHSYRYEIVRTDYQEMFEELEDGIWYKKNVMHLERELSDRFVLDVFAGNIDKPEEMAEKIFTFSDKIKEKRRQAIHDEWE